MTATMDFIEYPPELFKIQSQLRKVIKLHQFLKKDDQNNASVSSFFFD